MFLRRKEVTKVWNCWELVTHSWGRRKPVTHAGSPARNVSTSWQPLAGGRSSNTLQVADWVEQVFWSAGVAQKSLKGQLKKVGTLSDFVLGWVCHHYVPAGLALITLAVWQLLYHQLANTENVLPSLLYYMAVADYQTASHFCWWGLFSYIKPCLPNSLLRIALGRCIHYDEMMRLHCPWAPNNAEQTSTLSRTH